jgi:hypothetical protein
VENPCAKTPKKHRIDIHHENHSSDFLSEAGIDQKITSNEKKKQPLPNPIVRNCQIGFRLSNVGCWINLDNSQKL